MSQVDDRLIDEIYEAAIVPELWPTVLDGVARVSESWAGGLIAVDRAQVPRGMWTETYRNTYEGFARGGGNRYENVRAQRTMARRYQGFLRDIDLCTLEELEVDLIYRNFLRPYGLGWTVGTLMPMPTSDLVIFDFARRSVDGPHAERNVEVLDGLRPHLARAALLSSRLGLERARSMADALTALALPAAVLGITGNMLTANDAFEAVRVPIETAGLFAKARISPLYDPTGRAGVRSFPIAGTERTAPMVVHVVPVRRSALEIFSGAAAIVIVTSVAAPAVPPTEIVSVLFDLSPAEARVARGIAEGRSVEECARDFAVSPETVRVQLKRAMNKTGTHRQVDLARLLIGAAGPIAKGGGV